MPGSDLILSVVGTVTVLWYAEHGSHDGQWLGQRCLCCQLTHPRANVDVRCKALPLVNQPNWFGLKFANHQWINHKVWVFQIWVKWYCCTFLLSGWEASPMKNLDTEWKGFWSIKAKKPPHILTSMHGSADINKMYLWLLLYPVRSLKRVMGNVMPELAIRCWASLSSGCQCWQRLPTLVQCWQHNQSPEMVGQPMLYCQPCANIEPVFEKWPWIDPFLQLLGNGC